MIKTIHYIDTANENCINEISNELLHLIKNIDKKYEKIAFVCLGTPKLIGISYGILVGQLISKFKSYDFDIYGTLEDPVHNFNLKNVVEKIDIDKTLIIMISSFLDKSENVGKIILGSGQIKIKNAFGANFPSFGDIYIMGIVNKKGVFPIITLQNTGLDIVYKLADITSEAIKNVLKEIKNNNKNITK